MEDAAVLRPEQGAPFVLTVDFITPIVDDPEAFGAIAAANALSDVYAMGGHAITALNIVGWPKDLDPEILAEILAGGMDKIREAGAALCGGHTVQDSEIKYGLAVTGLVHPERFWRNSGAQEGDAILLTKPLGMGTISTALKRELVASDGDVVLRAMQVMAMLNSSVTEALAELTVHAATDVTGFGLIGHAIEMAEGAGLALEIDAAAVPIFDSAHELAAKGALSGGSKRGRATYGDRVHAGAGVDETRVRLFYDAETSGGLLVAVPADEADAAERHLEAAGCPAHVAIGRFVGSRDDGARIVLR